MKNIGEIFRALSNKEKVHHEHWESPHSYVHLVDGLLVDDYGVEIELSFSYPEKWHIWQEPVKEWQPKTTQFSARLIVDRVDQYTAKRDRRAWLSAIKLESFVREFAPDFVPVWGGRYCFLLHLNEGWHLLSGEHNQPGRVPFPSDEALAEKACEMLNNGTLKL